MKEYRRYPISQEIARLVIHFFPASAADFSVTVLKPKPYGKSLRIRPLLFSFVLHCHTQKGLAKYTAFPVTFSILWKQANSLPLPSVNVCRNDLGIRLKAAVMFPLPFALSTASPPQRATNKLLRHPHSELRRNNQAAYFFMHLLFNKMMAQLSTASKEQNS